MAPVIAVDLGGTWIRAGVVLADGQILAERSVATPQEGRGPEVITERVASLVRDLSGSFCPRPEAIGISAAGPVDIRRGALRNPPNLSFSDIPLGKPLSAEFDLPVVLANDCHCGIIGEAVCGDAQGIANAVYLTLSTGIGAGVLESGRLLLGRDGNAAEAGHFTVDSTYRIRCGCGHEGHWEGYASGRHLPRFFARWCEIHGRPRPAGGKGDPAGIFARVRNGDADAAAFIDELARINGRGISDLIVAYDPARIILDGGVVRKNGDLVYPRCLPFIDRFLPLPEIMVSRLNGRAPLLGAAVLALGEPVIPGTEVFRGR